MAIPSAFAILSSNISNSGSVVYNASMQKQDMPNSWIIALVAGALVMLVVILFLALYH